MKAFFSASLLLFVTAACACAEGSGIHATMTEHNDGTRSALVVDSDKRTAEERLETKDGKLLRLTTFLMDDRDQYLGSITSDPKGNVLYRTAFKRDGTGRVDEEVISTGEGALIRRRVYTFGAGNKVTSITEYDANGNATTTNRREGNAQAVAGAVPKQPTRRGKK